MEKIKPVNTEKYDFEYRDTSILLPLFDFRYYRSFDEKNKLNDLFIKFYQSSVVSDWDLRQTLQSGSYLGKWVWITKCINTNSTFWSFRTLKFLMQGSKPKTYSWNAPIKMRVFLWDLGDRNQTCSYRKAWIRISSWAVISSIFFWVFRLSSIWCNDQNQWLFNQMILYRNRAFQIDLDRWNQNWSSWEIRVWKSRWI